jgi:hypothetical protein
LNGSDMLDEYPNLSAYVARGEARPAFRRAFDAQLAVFTAASTGWREGREDSDSVIRLAKPRANEPRDCETVTGTRGLP